ncbi:hypothetical protein [Actinomycetospora sp. NBRC 106378]|uniref:hypothetical protein n=1 Tax=Actinomycetospora sp. NBRC 106378 TaxID=3032208 RepID=UPI0024A510FC|nr:hypothetical protein [Actinomycetospora sp. NBRC 106378]GLZ51287.1 hypothetical protein Acsp07_09040 [Actinomycetospora sp. NBRC 106378]
MERFDGWIGGLGTTAGLRYVIGHWPSSPLGTFTDVMVERPDGHRLLLAPSAAVAEFVAATYTFDEVRYVPVDLRSLGPDFFLTAGPLTSRFTLGGRSALGVLLRSVPWRLATAPWWIATIDAVARRVLPGVRTVGSAGGGRTEYYGAQDLRRIVSATTTFDGVDQGPLRPVSPAVRFGFGSTPTAPSWVRITTLVAGTGIPVEPIAAGGSPSG